MSIDPDRPSFRLLLDWLEGRLDADRAERIAAQMAEADEWTLGTVDWLRDFLTTTRELPLADPPPIVWQGLRQYFARWSRSRAQVMAGQKPPRVPAGMLSRGRQGVA